MGSPLILAAQQIDPEDGNVRPVAGPPTRDRPGLKEAVERVTAALRDLQYGTVTVTVVVQDGVIVRVERTERFRLTTPQRPRVTEAAR